MLSVRNTRFSDVCSTTDIVLPIITRQAFLRWPLPRQSLRYYVSSVAHICILSFPLQDAFRLHSEVAWVSFGRPLGFLGASRDAPGSAEKRLRSALLCAGGRRSPARQPPNQSTGRHPANLTSIVTGTSAVIQSTFIMCFCQLFFDSLWIC